MMISRSKHRSTVEVCADCGASDPSWASINRGLLLCAECCSIHRSMGRHISHVKSLRQGSWPPSLLAMVQALTAQNVNSIWEHSLLDAAMSKHLMKKPKPKDPLHPVKSDFILAKHLRLTYVLRARRDEPPSELGRQLHSAVRSGSLDTAMRLLAQGADPNYYNQEKGNTCLHVSCRAGQPSQAELLLAWGADPSARDHSGLTPADCARQGGHLELAERLTEVIYEATDKIIFFLSGEKPNHAAGSHYVVPRTHDTHEMTDVAKAARGKLQLLPNHLFEELVMDIYDEIDRRETEAIWQTTATGLERCGVVFLPVNPALSAPRNQGRQKLARLSPGELGALLRDVLVDATRREHVASLQPAALSGAMSELPVRRVVHTSGVSDDEPLYDSVASDDDYAALAPVDLDITLLGKPTGSIATFNQPLLGELALHSELRLPTPASNPTPNEIESLKKELDSRDYTITELKNQLKSLQTIVEQLTKENSVLKTNSIDDNVSTTSQNSINESMSNGLESKMPERGKSLETEQLSMAMGSIDNEVRLKAAQRPVSMFEPREGPKNNWQVTKHQLTTLSGLDGSLTLEAAAAVEGVEAVDGGQAVQAEHSLQRRAEEVTRAIHELWAAARAHSTPPRRAASNLAQAVDCLLQLFPQSSPDRVLLRLAGELRAAERGVAAACAGVGAGGGAGAGGGRGAALEELRAAAYELARATKQLLTHCQPS